MNRNRILFLAVGLAAVIGASGCSKKTPPTPDTETGSTGDVKPDATRVDKPRDFETKPLGESSLGDSEGGPLKDVYFDFDRYDIRADQRPALEANSRWLQANTAQTVLVEGHCDERGTEEYNLALGDRRANAARSYLVQLGIPSSRLNTISYGKAYPVDPGHDETAWARNRRAHFTLQAKGR